MQGKSKKVIAFDKERAKFRSEIRQLKSEIQSKDMQNRELKSKNDELVSEIYKLKDWNERLLEYMDMSEEDMRRILREKSVEAQVSESIRNLTSVFRGFGGF